MSINKKFGNDGITFLSVFTLKAIKANGNECSVQFKRRLSRFVKFIVIPHFQFIAMYFRFGSTTRKMLLLSVVLLIDVDKKLD
jgi:hypothetical protein